jgi:hypothetical protein
VEDDGNCPAGFSISYELVRTLHIVWVAMEREKIPRLEASRLKLTILGRVPIIGVGRIRSVADIAEIQSRQTQSR